MNVPLQFKSSNCLNSFICAMGTIPGSTSRCQLKKCAKGKDKWVLFSPKVTPLHCITMMPLTSRPYSVSNPVFVFLSLPLNPHNSFSATLFEVHPTILWPRGFYLLPCVSNLHLYVSVFYRSLTVLSNLHASRPDEVAANCSIERTD